MSDAEEKIKKLVEAANELAKKVVFEDAEDKIVNPFEVAGDMSVLDDDADEFGELLEQTLSDEEVNEILSEIDSLTHDKQEVAEWANVTMEILKKARNKFLSL